MSIINDYNIPSQIYDMLCQKNSNTTRSTARARPSFAQPQTPETLLNGSPAFILTVEKEFDF
jgi:hypothetical protein